MGYPGLFVLFRFNKMNNGRCMLKIRKDLSLVGLLFILLFTFGCAGMPGMGGDSKDDESTALKLPPYSGEKIKIAVMDFETKVPQTGYYYHWSGHGGVGRGASDMLTTELVKTKKYRIFERDKIASVMKEQSFQMSGAVDQTTAAKVGKLIGVKYILTGAVTEFGIAKSGVEAGGYVDVGKVRYSTSVDVRAVNVETGEILFADTGSHTLKSTRVKVLGFGGGERFDQKKASRSMRGAIQDLVKKIYIDLN
jgi:curli biogenesis system outer membrane secretion channel CsgG